MLKKLTVTLDQESYRRLCILVGTSNEEACIRYIEKWAKNAGANCYAPGELDAIFHAEGQEAAFQARMYARNNQNFTEESLEAEYQSWLSELIRESEEGLRQEEEFLTRLEADYRAEYEDPKMEEEFRNWLLGGWLLTPDAGLQRQAESWARSMVENSQPVKAEDAVIESR